MPQVAERYGIIIKRGKALCPFHQEKAPSMNIKPTYFHCFGCGTGGDVIRFAQLLFNRSPLDAVKQLNSDFGLGLDLDKPPDRAEVQRYKKRQALYRAFRDWEKEMFEQLCEELKFCELLIRIYKPFSDKWCEATQRKEVINYHLDILMYGDTETKCELQKQHRGKENIGKPEGNNGQTGSSGRTKWTV